MQYFLDLQYLILILYGCSLLQEIDGQSLLLLKRSDVLTGLNLKLGPALKIYQHVAKLQTVGIDIDDY